MPHGRWEVADLPGLGRHCEERSDEAIHVPVSGGMDCFAEPVIGRRVRADPVARNDGWWLLRGLSHRPEIGKIPAAAGCGIK